MKWNCLVKRYASVLTHQKVQLVHLIKKRCSHHAAIKEEALNLVKAKLSRTHTTDLPFDAYNPDFFIIKVESSDLYVVPEHLPLYFFTKPIFTSHSRRHDLPFFQLCQTAFSRPKLKLIHKQFLKDANVDISSLMEHPALDKQIQSELRQQALIANLLGPSYVDIISTVLFCACN